MKTTILTLALLATVAAKAGNANPSFVCNSNQPGTSLVVKPQRGQVAYVDIAINNQHAAGLAAVQSASSTFGSSYNYKLGAEFGPLPASLLVQSRVFCGRVSCSSTSPMVSAHYKIGDQSYHFWCN